MNSGSVLHVTSLPGGGVDRHIRDVARTVARHHLIWHTADTADVIEVQDPRRYFPLDREALARAPEMLATWLRGMGVGLVHAHSVTRHARARASWAMQALDTPALVTLHDVLFLRREGFEPGASRDPDPEWLGETAPFLRNAAAVIAPSDYLAGVAREHVKDLQVTVLPNGSPSRKPLPPIEPRNDFSARAHGKVAAVVGAIGPHKGSAPLEELADLLEGSQIDIVVVGYLDTRITHGWHSGHLYVHGAYSDDEVAPLLAAYNARLAIFPNVVPESFSFALSDVWAAGLPALVPPEGALGERVRRHGGGWLLPEHFTARDIDAHLRELLSPAGESELARVKSRLGERDPARLPTLDDMSHTLDALYRRYGIDPQGPIDPKSEPVQELLATNLDGALFRPEFVRLADALEQTVAFDKEARSWIAKLEGDVATMKEELRKEFELRCRYYEENVALRARKETLREKLGRAMRKIRGNARS